MNDHQKKLISIIFIVIGLWMFFLNSYVTLKILFNYEKSQEALHEKYCQENFGEDFIPFRWDIQFNELECQRKSILGHQEIRSLELG